MTDDLGSLQKDLTAIFEQSEPLQHAIGQFGKEEAIDVIQRALGSDQAFSGLRRRVKLGAGYDIGKPVVLNLRPVGLWFLADEGRKRSKKVYPRRRGGKQAVLTPDGPKAWFQSGRSRGHKVLVKTEKNIEAGIVDAAEKGLDKMIQGAGF